MSDIFLSYKNEDEPRAKIIAEALERHGYSVWWDHIIPPGKTWSQVIEEELNDAKCVIVLWSRKSISSDWVCNEAAEGAQKHILIPVLIDDVKIPLEFKRIQAARLIDWQGGLPNPEFDRLLKSVGEILGKPQVMKTDDKNSPVPSANQGKRREKERKEEGSTRRDRVGGDRVEGEERWLTHAVSKEFAKPPAAELTNKPVPPEVAKAKAAKAATKAALPKKSVLIINDDNDIHFQGNMSVLAFTLAFGNMGYEVRIEKSNETLYSTWSKYDIVVWSCGDDYSPINDNKSRQILVDYVAQGGRLILESGNIAAWNKESGGETIQNRKLCKTVLHATSDWVYHEVGNLTLKTRHPIATTPNKLPDTIDFTPTNPGDDSGDANAVRISEDAIGVYNWSHVAYGGNLVKESIASISYGLIAYDAKGKNGGKIVYYAFDIDDIDSPELKQKLIQNSENWLTRT